MMGVSLSRWTMSYFAAALVSLVLGQLLMATGYGFPSAPIRAPQTLVLVHIITIGWLSLLLCGALLQFVPVLVARPLHNNVLPLPALGILLAGLALLIIGFLQLDGIVQSTPSTFPYAGSALSIGFVIVLYDLGRTLWAARPLPLAARFVALALICLVVAVALGVLFSFAFANLVASDALLAIAAGGVPLHVTAGLGGWLTLAAMGVSYRLLAMFMLAPELDGPRPRAVLRLGAGALAVAILGGVALLLVNAALWLALLIAVPLGVAALVLYGLDVLHLYRSRKRPIIELNSRMAIPAFASLAASAVLTVVLVALNRFTEQVGTLVFLVVFGWLSGLGLAMLYKIVAFLTWLECYGPVLGKTATPRVQDLVVEADARIWFWLYYLAVWIATIALGLSHALGFRLAVVGMAFGTIMIAVQLVRTRLLTNQAATPLPEGAHRPRLFFSIPNPNS